MACLSMEKCKGNHCEHIFTLECVESDLLDLRGILELLYGYFKHDADYISTEPHAISGQYGQYGALSSACINEVDRILKAVKI